MPLRSMPSRYPRTSFSIALASNLALNSIYGNVDTAACVYVFGQSASIAMNTGTNTIATVFKSLMTVLSAGPAVSL